MNAVVLAITGLVAVFAGYRFYSRFIAEQIYRLDPDFETPSHAMRDDIDYVPTNKFVLGDTTSLQSLEPPPLSVLVSRSFGAGCLLLSG
ncbi:MAG: hypothetical protein Ct9H300mP25_09130 [Acidobacteriota bacterium]|nr:MAG: hypothetical protein Ct9H300mP25_09130 [Acidobacteriota bacterium]